MSAADTRLIAAAPSLVAALQEVYDLIEGYVDIRDGSDGVQLPNEAMIAQQVIEHALAKAGVKP